MSTPLLAFLAALLATAIYRPLGQHLRQLDEPNARSAHRRPVLSSGGIALIGGLLLALAIGHWRGLPSLEIREQAAALAALLLCALGAVDDRRPLSVTLRLPLFLLLSAATAALYLPSVNTGDYLWLVAVAVALAWVINLFNFMDGIDGIAALQCVLVALALALLVGVEQASGERISDYVVVAASVAAAYAAFLLFNWPPATLFMGDAGSLPGGYLLAWLGLWGWSEGLLEPQSWLLLMSPFLVDTGYTLCARLWRGARVTEAHSEHIYQRLARRWQSHRRVNVALLLLHGLWLLPLTLASARGWLDANLALALALLPQAVAALTVVARDRELQ